MTSTKAKVHTAAESRALGARYWRARIKQRPLSVEASRAGCSVSTLKRYGHLWREEHLSRYAKSTVLRPAERKMARRLCEEYDIHICEGV